MTTLSARNRRHRNYLGEIQKIVCHCGNAMSIGSNHCVSCNGKYLRHATNLHARVKKKELTEALQKSLMQEGWLVIDNLSS